MDARVVQPATDEIVFDTVSDTTGLARLKDDWRAFFERAGKPQQVFQSHGFLTAWTRHYLKAGEQLRVVVGRRDARIVAILPLLLRRRWGVGILAPMGFPIAQFGDVLLDDGLDAVEGHAIFTHLRSIGADLLLVPKLRADTALARLLPPECVSYDRQEAPYAELETRVAEDGPGEAYPARMRSSHRRRLRRLEEAGAVRFRTLGPGNDARGLARHAVEMKREWMSARSIWSPTVSCMRFGAFFEDVAGGATTDTPLFVTALEHGGRTVAIDLSFDCKGSTFGHVHSTDADYRQDGVGHLLVDAVFRAARDRGNARFELMAPADIYKMRHADGVTEVADRALGFSARGRLAALALRLGRPAARRALRVAPDFLRKVLAGG